MGDYQRELILALGYAAAGQGEAADQQVASIIARHPENLEVLTVVGDFYISYGDSEKAADYFERAVIVDNTFVPALLGQARATRRLGDLRSAAELYESVLIQEENNILALVNLADLRAIEGNAEQSIELLELAVLSNAVSPVPRVMLAQVLARQGEVIRAEQLAQEASRMAPEDGLTQAEVGSVLLDTGKHIEALSYLRKAIDLAPQSSTAWYYLARAQLALDESADARVSLNRAIELNPASVDAISLLALLELRSGDLERALAVISEAKSLNPDYALPLSVAADILMEMARYAEAAEAYSGVYDLVPSARFAMRAYQASSQAGIENPASLLIDWIADSPEDWGAQNMLAMHYEEVGDFDNAIRAYEQAIASNAANFVAMNNLAVRYSELGDERAESIAEQAYALRPNIPVVADTLGWIKVKKGDVAGGLPMLQEAAANAQNSGNIQYHLAYALNELDDASGSAAILTRILEAGIEFSERDAATKLLNEISGEN
jgi:putative PEP-CTERM system TPR-repeat lipoprotein